MGSRTVKQTLLGPAHSAGGGGDLSELLKNNKEWAASVQSADPNFFGQLAHQQLPQYLWIGCSDSRVPANQILGLAPGEVFVQRNVGNLATHKDMNCMSCLEYAVDVLKVKHIIVCGHYNCGAVRASLQLPIVTPGLVNLWIADIRDTRNKYQDKLRQLDRDTQVDRLCELNVVRQVFNVSTSPVVQSAWARGQGLTVTGLIYSVSNGLLKELTPHIANANDWHKHSAAAQKARGAPEAAATLAPADSLVHDLYEHFSTHLSFDQSEAALSAGPVPWQKQKEEQPIDEALHRYSMDATAT